MTVLESTRQERTLRQLGNFDVSEGVDLFAPYWIEVIGDELYLTNEIMHRIEVFDLDLNPKRWIGNNGKNPGEFYYPGQTTHQGDWLIIADKWNHRIQEVHLESGETKAFGSYGYGLGEFNEPCGVLALGDVLFVAERSQGRIQAFDNKREVVFSYQGEGPALQYYESDLFRQNVHYKRWSSSAHRFATMESLFSDNQFVWSAIEYPECLYAANSGDVLIHDSTNQELVEFTAHLEFKGRVELPPETEFIGYDSLRGESWLAGDGYLYYLSRDEGMVRLKYDGKMPSSLVRHENRLFIAGYWDHLFQAYEIV